MNNLLRKILFLSCILYLASCIPDFLSILNLLFPNLYAYPPGWSDDILLTPEDDKVRMDPDVDVDGFNNVWAVWDSGNWVNNTAEVLYSKRDSLGGCLIPETEVSIEVPYSNGPRIAVDGSNNIHFIWREISPLGMGLGYAKLTNSGAVLVPSHLVISGAGGGSSSLMPEIAINKYNEINIIWDESPSGYNQMNWTKLDSIGNPIISKIRVSPQNINALWPGLGVDSFANVHLGYRTDFTSVESLAYTKVDKDGNILISNKILDTGLLPSIIADRSQNIHIVYPHQGYYNWVINYIKLNQQGNIIVWPKTLSPIQHASMSPHMAMDSLQYLHVVWEFNNWVDTLGIMYTKLDTLGNFVIPPTKVVYPPYPAGGGLARIAVDRNNRLHLVWVDDRLNPSVSADIFYKRGENEHTVRELTRLKAQKQSRISVYPNPFTGETKISFSLSRETEKAKIEIFDILGRKVKEFSINGSSGIVQWNGRDNDGALLASGVYLIRLSDSELHQSMIVVLLR